MNICPECEYSMVKYGDNLFCIKCGYKSYGDGTQTKDKEDTEDTEDNRECLK